jgi:hypothetical protein
MLLKGDYKPRALGVLDGCLANYGLLADILFQGVARAALISGLLIAAWPGWAACTKCETHSLAVPLPLQACRFPAPNPAVPPPVALSHPQAHTSQQVTGKVDRRTLDRTLGWDFVSLLYPNLRTLQSLKRAEKCLQCWAKFTTLSSSSSGVSLHSI